MYDYSITADGPEIDERKIRSVLEVLGLNNVLVESLLNFEATVKNFPDEEIPGLGDICVKWINSLGEESGRSADGKRIGICMGCMSDNPRALTRALHEKICSYGKPSFESAAMVCDYMDKVLNRIKGE